MPYHFAKTRAGRDEVKTRSRPLPGPARHLLEAIDESRPPEDWFLLVHGANNSHLAQLAIDGLLEPRAAPETHETGVSLEQALARFEPEQLRALLVSLARGHLGFIRGFAMALDARRCNSADELRAMARRILERVERQYGAVEAARLRHALGATD
jgi:hypothetical protein